MFGLNIEFMNNLPAFTLVYFRSSLEQYGENARETRSIKSVVQRVCRFVLPNQTLLNCVVSI